MTQPLVECVPNFSEGRRADVIEAILDAIRAVAGVTLLDYSSDVDHNRTVVTFIAPPDVVGEAAFQAIRQAAALIDMRQHTGEHPRIGATDVVPFIPIRGLQMSDCIQIARSVGQRVGEELSIPVYLYERAALRPERENLEVIRKGEYEGLCEVIASDPARAPDFGPVSMGAPGATVIGARAPLVAYNVYLNTSDVEIANRIARAVRNSGGGLRFLKAMGVMVGGRAQVSMNLTDFTKTPIHRVQEMIRSEAARYGVQVVNSELVGLIPEQALIDTARWYLQLDMFNEDQLLERKLASSEESTVGGIDDFVSAVASSEPAPGGGSVAALAGALAAALAGMVARTTLGKKKYAEVEPAMQAIATSVDVLRAQLTAGIAEDSDSFKQVLAAYRLPQSDSGREQAIQQALTYAAQVPLKMARLSAECLPHLQEVAAKGNLNAVSDAGAGAYMALAAVEAASLNVLINTKSLSDPTVASELRGSMQQIAQSARQQVAEIGALVRQRMEIA
jgi:glutamate formiminotransferase/formiminotetrahydrofolate cyclodeaminase